MSAHAGAAGLPQFTPIQMIEVEIGCPLADIPAARDREGAVYTRAWVLVRLHDEPLGIVELALSGGTLDAGSLAKAIFAALREDVNEHLEADGMVARQGLDAAGVPGMARPPCIVARDRACVGTPLISVIIGTRDRTDSLAACLAAFDQVTYPNYEIIVVDNAPATEATAELIASRFSGDARIRYVREARPGLGWARNCGLRHARGGFLAFTDDDVVVDRHWLSELLRGFALGNEVGCVTGLVVPQEIETPSQYWFDTHSGFNKGFRRRQFDLRTNRPGDPLFPYRSSMFGTGANMAFRAQTLRVVGGFDPVLGAGTPAKSGEDLDIYFRIIEAGYQLVYLPSAFVHHRHRADYAALREQFYSYGVGFAAYLTKRAVVNPLDGVRLMLRMPAMVAFARRAEAKTRSSAGGQYPPELPKVERRGQLYGPVAYARSWWHCRRALRHDRRG